MFDSLEGCPGSVSAVPTLAESVLLPLARLNEDETKDSCEQKTPPSVRWEALSESLQFSWPRNCQPGQGLGSTSLVWIPGLWVRVSRLFAPRWPCCGTSYQPPLASLSPRRESRCWRGGQDEPAQPGSGRLWCWSCAALPALRHAPALITLQREQCKVTHCNIKWALCQGSVCTPVKATGPKPAAGVEHWTEMICVHTVGARSCASRCSHPVRVAVPRCWPAAGQQPKRRRFRHECLLVRDIRCFIRQNNGLLPPSPPAGFSVFQSCSAEWPLSCRYRRGLVPCSCDLLFDNRPRAARLSQE